MKILLENKNNNLRDESIKTALDIRESKNSIEARYKLTYFLLSLISRAILRVIGENISIVI